MVFRLLHHSNSKKEDDLKYGVRLLNNLKEDLKYGV